MSDQKISALTAATTPLAGTEVLPIVQSGATVNVSVANLTAGRAVSGTSLTASTGNVVIGTATKGIDFSVNTGAPGMTSELLTWYEEGTWTPNQGAGLTVIGTFSSSGSYTRIGRQVTIVGKVAGSTSVACSTFGVICANLPFNPGVFNGFLVGGTPTAIQPTVCSAGILYSNNAVSASSEINFVHTYFV